jgi:hypothetical protein
MTRMRVLEGVGPSLLCMEIKFVEYSMKKIKLLPFVVWRRVQFVEHEGGCFRNKSLERGQRTDARLVLWRTDMHYRSIRST